MHDAVAGRNHADVFKRGFTPFDEVKTIFVAAIFNRAVFLKRIRFKPCVFDRKRVVNNQLRFHHRVHFGRIAALLCYRIAQASQINQRGLAKNVVTHHARRIPGEIKVAFAFNQLFQGVCQCFGFAAANQVFSQNARGIRQRRVGTGRNCVDRFFGIKITDICAGQQFPVLAVDIVLSGHSIHPIHYYSLAT